MAPIHPQFITAGDEQLVVITRAEFDLLMAIATREDREEADDIAVFDDRMAELESGTDARLPGAVSKFMLDGHGLLMALRRWRGMTPDAVSVGAGLTRARLDDIESGRGEGRPDEMRSLAKTLAIDPAWLT